MPISARLTALLVTSPWGPASPTARSPRYLLHTCLRRGTFCHQRQKVPKERRQNQWFWNPCAVVVRKVSKIFTLANKTTQIRSLLSHCPCVYPPRRAPRLCCPSKQGGPLRLPFSGRRGRRPLRNSIGKRSVGADAYIGPPHRTLKNPLFFPFLFQLSSLPLAPRPTL